MGHVSQASTIMPVTTSIPLAATSIVPALEPDIMTLVAQLYQAQMVVQNAHLALQGIEANLNQAASSDPTLPARAHFAYDALCRLLAAVPPSTFSLPRPSMPTISPDPLDFDAFASAFKTTFPNSDHLFDSSSSATRSVNGVPSNYHPSHVPTPTPLAPRGTARTTSSVSPTDSRPGSSLEDLLAIHDLPPNEVLKLETSSTPSSSSGSLSTATTAATTEVSASRSTIGELVTSGPLAGHGMTVEDAGATAGRLHFPMHPGAQLLLHASSISDAEGVPAIFDRSRRFGSPTSIGSGNSSARKKRNGSSGDAYAAVAGSPVEKRVARRRVWESDQDAESDSDDERRPVKQATSRKGSAGVSGSGRAKENGDAKAKPKVRRQPRTMSYDDTLTFPLNETHHFLLVQTKSNQPELSDRACTELFLIAAKTSPSSPLGRALLPHPNSSRTPYTALDYAEDVRLQSEYTFHTAAGVTYDVKFLPEGPRIQPTLPIASHSTILNFIHFPPQTIVISPSPIGSLPWWRVQSCIGEAKHRGMPGPDGAWTARWDKDPRDRRPARIVEHFGKCRWRSAETDPVGRLARALLATSVDK